MARSNSGRQVPVVGRFLVRIFILVWAPRGLIGPGFGLPWRTKFQAFRDVMCGYRTYNDLISEDPETVSTVRRIAQRKLEEELEYVETDSVYSYRL